MKTTLKNLITLMCVCVTLTCGAAWAIDEAVLTPTNDTTNASEDQVFNQAMSVWLKHDYSKGESMLLAFAKNYPNSRWRAEAELHAGCYLTFLQNYSVAKPLFEGLASEFSDTNIREKANIRLGNIAEMEGRWADAKQYYSGIMRMNPTWGQFKYANFNARRLAMSHGAETARTSCGPVALAACLNALGRTSDAALAKSIQPTSDGVSLAVLAAQANGYGIPAQCVEMPFDSLKNATLPVLAHVAPNHFIAILGIRDEKAQVEDSIKGKYELSLDSLQRKWTGKALIFAQDVALTPMSLIESIETKGGCCGNNYTTKCLGDPCNCKQGSTGPASGNGTGWGGGCGGGTLHLGSELQPGCIDELVGAGRPTWELNVVNLNLLVTDIPIFYTPGTGPKIAFKLRYSNEGSNTGIFGQGWRSPYDTKTFFMPDNVYQSTTTTQTVTTSSPRNGNALSVTSTTGFPSIGAIMLISGTSSEVITYTGKTSNSFTGITRSPSPIGAASGSEVDMHTPMLQVFRDDGSIETYQWNNTSQAYTPWTPEANYGYVNTIAYASSGIVLSLLGGGKDYFKPEGDVAEGRISIIEDKVGNQVTCGYDSYGRLNTVTDAAGGVTEIVPYNQNDTGLNERVGYIRIPRNVGGSWVQWSNDSDPYRRQAALQYTNGNLTSIEDMLGDTSTLSYNAMLFYTGQASAYTYLSQAITTTSPANGEAIGVSDASGFFASGQVTINSNEVITYTGKTRTSLTGITRGATPAAASSGASVVQVAPSTSLTNAITTTSPANGGTLVVGDTTSFPSSGWIGVVGSNGTECMSYSGKTTTTFTNITRGDPTYAETTGTVYLCSQTPYLSEIVTPSKKTRFTYEWYCYPGYVPMTAGLHEVYECGPTESYPSVPTIHYAWCYYEYETKETRYPTSVRDGVSGCDDNNSNPPHWTGGHTKIYNFDSQTYDSTNFIVDELSNTIAQYGYDNIRDRTSVADASGNITYYSYDPSSSSDTWYGDGLQNMYYRTDPLNYVWAYTYNTDHTLYTETNAYASGTSGSVVKTYTYNQNGQLTQIDTPLGTIAINHYDSSNSYRMDWSKDGNGKQTNYYYNQNGETRGLLTSVQDPEGKTTQYHYDADGRRDQVTDPSGNVTQYLYDDLDRVIKVIYGGGANDPCTQTVYTCCHKVYQQDENGRRTYYVYDAKVRPYKTIASALSTTLATGITTTTPANSGNLAVASVTNFPSSGKVVISDEIISYTGIDTQNNYLTGITRGADGSMIVGADSGSVVGRVDTVSATYGYDSQYLDWMISLTDALGHTTYYQYYDNSKLKSICYPDNEGEQYTYDNNNSGNNLITKEYGTFSGQNFTATSGLTLHYTYDGNNRLLGTSH